MQLWMVLSFRCWRSIGHLLCSGHGVSHVVFEVCSLVGWDGTGDAGAYGSQGWRVASYFCMD